MAEGENWLVSGRLPLSDEAFERIVKAACERLHKTPLPRPAPEKLARLRRDLEEAGAWWRVGHAVSGRRPSRSDEVRRFAAIVSAAANLVEALGTAALVRLGHLLDQERGADEYTEPSGFELVGNDVEAVRRILRLAQEGKQEAKRRLDTGASAQGRGERGRFVEGTPVKRSRGAWGPDIVGDLAGSFERAFERRAGASRGGPLARLAGEFFKVHHEELKALASAKAFLLLALRNGPRAVSEVVQEARKAGIQTPPVLVHVDHPSKPALQHAKPLESIPKSALEQAADALGVQCRRRATAAPLIEGSRNGTRERRHRIAVVLWALPPGTVPPESTVRQWLTKAVPPVPSESTLARWVRGAVASHRKAQLKLGKGSRSQHAPV